MASDAANFDNFGFSVSISSGKALVGARFDDDLGSGSGSAYIYELSGGVWTETNKLLASDGGANDDFGYSVCLTGSRALVGARLDDHVDVNTGSAYVFELNGGVWSETQKLQASDAAASDYFGNSVSIFGNKVIVGADGNVTTSGSAYIYELSGGVWSETQKLLASDGIASSEFGSSCSIYGNRAVDGGRSNSEGAAYIYELNNGIWAEVKKIESSDGVLGDNFGDAVAMFGDRIIVGAEDNDDAGSNSGSAYIFEWNGVVMAGNNYLSSDNNSQLLPNPIKGIFTIDLGEVTENTSITVYDMLGKVIVRKESITSTTQIDLSGNEKGIYFVKMVNGENSITRRIIKQ